MLRQLAGSTLSEEDLGEIVSKAFQEAGGTKGNLFRVLWFI